MKILEAQSAILPNVEVLAHLESMRKRYDEQAQQKAKPRNPRGNKTRDQQEISSLKSGNLETVMKELTDYLLAPPSSLTPNPDLSRIQRVMEALRQYGLTKPELIQIINLRPDNIGVLDTIIEEMDQRYTEDEQQEILAKVKRELGTPGFVTGTEGGGERDTIMIE